MQINQFWQKWLFVVTILVAVFGIILMIPNESVLFDRLFNDRIEAIFWSDITITTGILQFQRWMNGVLGATMVGWGITMAFIVAIPFRKGERWAWNCILIGIVSWFILDTGLSIFYQAVFNAAFNTVFLLLFLLPLLATYKVFYPKLRHAKMS